MSTFCGQIQEIPGLSVDRFDYENKYSQTFFLSHCHTDHMLGLTNIFVRENLVKENKFLYVSAVSSVILKALFPNIGGQLKELPLDHAISIQVLGQSISVTSIPAGHCPGSVMFLFETNDVRVLYTGDYRISPSDVRKFKCFYDDFNNVKPVDKIYLDTTFFLKSYAVFPKREESLSEVCKIILEWINQDPQNCVKLDTGSARYGYEYVYKEVYEQCKMPVHIDEEKFKFYSVIPELDRCVTTDGALTRIYSCSWRQTADYSKLRTVKVSAFRWELENLNEGFSNMENGIFYVCYSTHASYEEGLALIEFIKPKDIHICVERPRDPDITKRIQKLVKEKIDEINKNDVITKKPKLFKVSENNYEESPRSSSEDYLDSPPKKQLRTSSSILDSPPR